MTSRLGSGGVKERERESGESGCQQQANDKARRAVLNPSGNRFLLRVVLTANQLLHCNSKANLTVVSVLDPITSQDDDQGK